MARAWLRLFARIGGWTGCLLACASLRWIWREDVSTARDSIQPWFYSTLGASLVAGASAAVGLGLVLMTTLDPDADLARRARRWRTVAWAGAFLVPSYFAGQFCGRLLSQALLEGVVLPEPGVPPDPPAWYKHISPVFLVQTGIAASVAGLALILFAWWRHAEVLREQRAAGIDSGRWE